MYFGSQNNILIVRSLEFDFFFSYPNRIFLIGQDVLIIRLRRALSKSNVRFKLVHVLSLFRLLDFFISVVKFLINYLLLSTTEIYYLKFKFQAFMCFCCFQICHESKEFINSIMISDNSMISCTQHFFYNIADFCLTYTANLMTFMIKIILSVPWKMTCKQLLRFLNTLWRDSTTT